MDKYWCILRVRGRIGIDCGEWYLDGMPRSSGLVKKSTIFTCRLWSITCSSI